jgi:hypothetical protein
MDYLKTNKSSRKKTSVKAPIKKQSTTEKQSKADSIKWQTKLKKIWQAYKIPIIAIIILVVVLLFIISQKSDVNKKEVQLTKIQAPMIEVPAAPALKPAPTP